MKKTVISYAMIALMAMLLALDYHLFVVPNEFAPAGLNGIATMVQHLCNFSIGYMSLIINVPLCIFAYFFVDKCFAVRTLVFSVVYSVSYLLLGLVNLDAFRYDAGGNGHYFPRVYCRRNIRSYIFGMFPPKRKHGWNGRNI